MIPHRSKSGTNGNKITRTIKDNKNILRSSFSLLTIDSKIIRFSFVPSVALLLFVFVIIETPLAADCFNLIRILHHNSRETYKLIKDDTYRRTIVPKDRCCGSFSTQIYTRRKTNQGFQMTADIISIFPYTDSDEGEENYDRDDEKRRTSSATSFQKNHQSSPPIMITDEKMRQYQKIRQINDEKDAKWKRTVHEFKEQVLDPSYVALPVRSSTIEAASMYVPSSTESTSHTTNTNLMPGSHKHLGGAYDKTDGCIYGVPANARSVLCLYPVNAEGKKISLQKQPNDHTDNPIQKVVDYHITTIPLPESVYQYQFKWLRGIFAHGYMWAIPSWANCVLCVDIDAYWGRRTANNNDEIVQLIPLPKEHELQTWQWHGAGMNHEQNAIYCIPSNAKKVLKVDLISKTTSLIDINGYDAMNYPNFSIDMTNKWYGGITGADNCVYGIPYRSCAVLKINCGNDTATLVGPDYGATQYNWHGGIQVNGKIYAHPSHADTVLVIDTNPITSSSTTATAVVCANKSDVCIELPVARASYDTCAARKYKWLGGVVGIDGNIYCPACDASAVLKIDTKTQKCTTFGFAGTSVNKWQGGILGRDGCVYCIPASGRSVLRIATTTNFDGNEEDRVQLIGENIVPNHKDKWQGGYQGLDGSLYFIPENGYRIMKVTPPVAFSLLDGKLRHDDCKVEML